MRLPRRAAHQESVGADYVAGKFDRKPENATAIARRAAKFAPELVKGHTDPIAGMFFQRICFDLSTSSTDRNVIPGGTWWKMPQAT